MAIQKHDFMDTIGKHASIGGIEVTVYVPATENVPHFRFGSRSVSLEDNPGFALLRAETITAIAHEFTALLGGATVNEGRGWFALENGAIVSENVTKISVLVPNEIAEINGQKPLAYFQNVADRVKTIFRQQSVLVTFTPVFASFV